MIVIINSECTGTGRYRSQAILDTFLPRVGRRTWAGSITIDGLERLKKTLLKKITINNSICCKKVATRRRLSVEWIIGNKNKFDGDGNCSISETSKAIFSEYELSSAERLLYETSALAALFHDLGKNTAWFQLKLLAAPHTFKPLSDPIRHELISFAVLKAMFELSDFDEDKWLKNLSNKENLFSFIDRAYSLAFERSENGDLIGLKKQIFYKPGSDITSQLYVKDMRPSTIDFYPDEKKPIFSLVALLILTHHRLPYGDIKKFYDKQDVLVMQGNNMTNGDYNSTGKTNSKKLTPKDMEKGSENIHIRKAMDCISSLPDSKIKMHSDSRFLDQVAFTAKKLSEVKSTNFDLDVRIASIYGRTALILGDHKASKIGNTKFPIEGEPINRDLVYANTNKERSSQLAEPLASHLCRVAAKTNKALNSLIIEPNQMPSLSFEETPRTIRYPDPGKGTPFEWQYQSSKATKKALNTISDDCDVGFFGILMAGTGSGKTRMAPIIMSALSDNKLRINVCTGMRTLTLQGGLEYQRDMGFKSEDVSVVIGDKLTSELFNLDHTSVGTEAENLDSIIVAQLSEEKSGYSVALPDNIKKVMTSDKNEDSDNIFMATPILVSTIDTLMAAADATRGGHVLKSLRVATADLVIDEIDDYANEDLVAIARLVYLSAVFGRKVLLSSATISPEIALSMYNAYQAGRNVYDHLKQNNSPTIIGWYSEVSEPKIEVVNSMDFHFADHHKDFICNIVKALELKNARRKLEIFETSNDSKSKFFDSIIDGMLRLHHDNHVVDEKTGKRVSLGVIRWTNVLPSFLCSQELLKTVDRNADILVVPYNGAMLPVMRYHTERMLNSMLKRKYSETDTDPVLRNKAIREALETRTTKKDVIIVTVTTSIEEVGRDHDFDWAIVEPGSVRSLVQMAGRVKRHRPHITASKPNMLLLQKCFKEVLALFSGKSYHSDNYYLPHIVLRNRNYLNSVKEKFSLDTHDSDIIYDICKLSNKIDASECISEIDQINSKLQTNERLLTKAYLLDDLHEEEYLSVNHYSNDYMSILTNFHQRHRKFRRSDRFDVPYSYVEGSEGNFDFYIYDKEINQTYNLSINNLIDILEINIDRLLLRHKNIKSLTDDLANRLWSGDDESFGQKKKSLTTIIRPLHSADQRLGRKGVKYTDHKMLFEQNLGMVEKPKWYQTI